MEIIERFLGGYSENFAVAVAAWPFFSFALTLPILAYLYHRDGRLKLASVVTVYLAVLYVLGLGCFTLYPLPSGEEGLGITYGIPWQLNPFAFLGDIAKDGIHAVPQILFNIVFFMPLGFIAGRFLRLDFAKSTLLGLAVSFAIEAAQGTGLFGVYPYSYRTADVDDLIWNTSGAAVGWLVASRLARILPPGALAEEGEVTDRPGIVRRFVAFWLDMTLVGVASTIVWAAGLFVAWGVMAAGVQNDALAAAGGTAMLLIPAVMFVAVEGAIPFMRKGQTPGGSFVRMTCETRERMGWRRVAFFLLRLFVLGCMLLFFPLAAPVLLIFYAVKRRMPYDLL